MVARKKSSKPSGKFIRKPRYEWVKKSLKLNEKIGEKTDDLLFLGEMLSKSEKLSKPNKENREQNQMLIFGWDWIELYLGALSMTSTSEATKDSYLLEVLVRHLSNALICTTFRNSIVRAVTLLFWLCFCNCWPGPWWSGVEG